MSPRRSWGTVDAEAMPSVLFDVKTWKDDAAPKLVELERKLDRVEDRHDALERKIDNGFAALKAIGWFVGILWTVAIVIVGFYQAAK